MSFRHYIDGVQIFGNNDYYPEWEDFLEKNGVKVDKDDGFYEGYITDVKGMFETIDTIVRNMLKETEGRIADLNYGIKDDMPILEMNKYVIEHYYIFLPLQVLNVVKDKLELDRGYKDDRGIQWFPMSSYKLKDGMKIRVSGG
jgi:hypothetical protein